jgi:hypothetical protein
LSAKTQRTKVYGNVNVIVAIPQKFLWANLFTAEPRVAVAIVEISKNSMRSITKLSIEDYTVFGEK